MAHAGITTLIDGANAIAHNKVVVIDSETIITGSFNFTTAAERQNAETLLVIRDKALAARYAENWQAHATHRRATLGDKLAVLLRLEVISKPVLGRSDGVGGLDFMGFPGRAPKAVSGFEMTSRPKWRNACSTAAASRTLEPRPAKDMTAERDRPRRCQRHHAEAPEPPWGLA